MWRGVPETGCRGEGERVTGGHTEGEMVTLVSVTQQPQYRLQPSPTSTLEMYTIMGTRLMTRLRPMMLSPRSVKDNHIGSERLSIVHPYNDPSVVLLIHAQASARRRSCGARAATPPPGVESVNSASWWHPPPSSSHYCLYSHLCQLYCLHCCSRHVCSWPS